MNFGFGSQQAGVGVFGLELVTGAPPLGTRAPAALAFDGLKKDFVLNTRGGYVGQHPIDAKVWLTIRTALNSIRSAPTVGQGVRRIKFIDKRTIVAEISDLLKTALGAYVAAKEIRINKIPINLSFKGGVLVLVDYSNLVSKGAPAPQLFMPKVGVFVGVGTSSVLEAGAGGGSDANFVTIGGDQVTVAGDPVTVT